MRRIIFRVAIFALAFGLGVGVSAGWRLYQWSLVPFDGSSSFGDDALPAEPSRPTGLVMVGGIDACGPTVNFHNRSLSDGTWIQQNCRHLSSPAAAARELKKRLGNAQVVTRSDELDGDRVIGQEFLITSPTVTRFTLTGATLCETTAATVTHLELYEKGMIYMRPARID